MLWAPWKSQGEELVRAKRDATLLVLKLQEDAGIDILTEGEQARQHFVHGFLEKVEGIDFAHKVEMGIRKDRYKAMVPQVVAPLRLKGRVHAIEARVARTHTTRKLKFTLPGPMTIIDTIADQYYGDRVKMAFAFAELLNEEAKALQADGIDLIQFDEPAFNVYMDEVSDWGIKALERAAEGLTCATAVHICYGYGIKANTDWKETLGKEWRQYETIFPAIDKSPIQQVAIECRNSRVPLDLLALLPSKIVQAGVIDVASDTVETAEDVVKVIEDVSKFVAKSRIIATTNCGMAPMHRDIAEAKLVALGAGAALARHEAGMRLAPRLATALVAIGLSRDGAAGARRKSQPARRLSGDGRSRRAGGEGQWHERKARRCRTDTLPADRPRMDAPGRPHERRRARPAAQVRTGTRD